MSPRPVRLRKISNPPLVSGFKPYGTRKGTPVAEIVFLHIEEYEALRLCDFEMLNHHQASVIMDVSRPTLTRIYARARQKIAQALVRGSQIIIEGGKIYFDSEWYTCEACGCYFNDPEKKEAVRSCPLCKSSSVAPWDEEAVRQDEFIGQCNDFCVCTVCRHEASHTPGIPCKEEKCPRCGGQMVRKGTPHSKKF